MFNAVLLIHSWWRWLVLITLAFAIYRAIRGWFGMLPFTPFDNRVRHITATLAHVQLVLGYILYLNSPLVRYFELHYNEVKWQPEFLFFGVIHVTFMTVSIILITIGSASAKRKTIDKKKFKTMAIWYLAALIIIIIAIPWPFSPLANRPFLRY